MGSQLLLGIAAVLVTAGGVALLAHLLRSRWRAAVGFLSASTLVVAPLALTSMVAPSAAVTETDPEAGVSFLTKAAGIYQRMAVDVEQWPTMGQLIPVVYSTKNPDKWGFGSDEAPPPPPPPPPPRPASLPSTLTNPWL